MIVKGFNRTTIECWYKKMRQNTCKCETNWDSQNSDLPTKLSNCWSQSKRRNCEWEVDWCLIRWWRDPASEPSALSRGQYECKEKSTFCLLVFFIIIHIYLFNFLVPVGMLWKAQSPEVNSAQTTSKDSGWFCGPLWCTVCENKVVPVHFTFALWLKNLTLTVLMYLQFYVTSQKENK